MVMCDWSAQMAEVNQNLSETSENEDRRKFLATCGRFAIVTPPAITTLLSTSLTSTAIARSGGSVGYSSGGKRSFLDDLFDNGPDDRPHPSGQGNRGQGQFSGGSGGGGSGSGGGPSTVSARSGGGGYSESQAGAGGGSRPAGMGGDDKDDKPRKDKEPEGRRADR
jgi:hypothetical protein